MKNILLVSLLVVFAACSKKEESKTENMPLEEVHIIEVDSVPGQNQYIVTEEIFWLMPQEQEDHFEKAKDNHEQKEFKSAAAEIRKSTLYLDQEIAKAKEGDGKNSLITAKAQLASLGDRLERGDKVTPLELKEAFYQTNKALYRNYLYQQATVTSDYDFEKNKVDAHLDAALQRVKNAEKWSGKKLDKEGNEIIEEGKNMSQKIKEATKQDKKALVKAWNEFLKKLRALDDKLEGNDGVY